MARKRSRINESELQHYGEEPIFTKESTAVDVTSAFNWYHYCCTPKQRKEWLMELMRKESAKSGDLAAVKAHRKVGIAGVLARMISRGAPLGDEQMINLRREIAKTIAEGKKKTNTSSKRPTVQENIAIQVDAGIEILEPIIDQIFETGKLPSDFNLSEQVLKKIGAKAVHTNKIANYITQIETEFSEAVSGTDAQLAEGYAVVLRGKKSKGILSALAALKKELSRWGTTHKTVRTRKKRKKSVEKVVKQVQYKESDDKYSVVGLSAEMVVGQQMLLMFNTRNAYLHVIYADNPDGLSFKGTTLQGWDKTLSYQMRLKKPMDIIPIVMKEGKRKTEAALKTNTNKHTETTGRCNKHCLFLRTF